MAPKKKTAPEATQELIEKPESQLEAQNTDETFEVPEATQELEQGTIEANENLSVSNPGENPNETAVVPERKPEPTIFTVAIDFYSKDKDRRKYEKGQDVSHFRKDRLESLVKRGIVVGK